MAEGTVATHGETPEQWRPVPGFPGYEVSDRLRVGSYWKRGRGGRRPDRSVLKPGASQVQIRAAGAPRRWVKIRWLVSLAWGEEVSGLKARSRNRLTPEDVREAVRLKAEGVPSRLIGERFGVSRPTAQRAATGRTYKHVHKEAG